MLLLEDLVGIKTKIEAHVRETSCTIDVAPLDLNKLYRGVNSHMTMMAEHASQNHLLLF